MQRYEIAPVPESDVTNGASQLQIELRRTMAWVAFCEAQIQKLETEREMIFGLAGTEFTESEESGTEDGEDKHTQSETRVTRYEAAYNGWVNLLNWNRGHLLQITKQWIAAGFTQQRLELERAQVGILAQVIDRLVIDLGHDATDPATGAIVRDAINAITASA